MTAQTTIQSQAVSKDNSTFLRNSLRGNAAFSILTGLASIFASRPIAEYMGINPPTILIALGVGLISFAAFVLYTATQSPIDKRSVIAIIVGDVLWVLGSVALLLTNIVPFTTAGKWEVGIIAGIVALFADLQLFGLWKMSRSK